MSAKKLLGVVGAVVVAVVLVGLVVGFYFVPPSTPRITVTNASLTQFYLNNGTLNYNLALNLAFRNPSKTIQINYKHIEVTARYIDERFPLNTVVSSPFKQGRGDTVELRPSFQGLQSVKFTENDLSRFQSETVAGAYSFEVVIVVQIKRITDKPHAMCLLKVPMSLNSTSSSGSFHATTCSVQKS